MMSAVDQVCDLEEGQAYSRSVVIPYGQGHRIPKARRDMNSNLAPVVARAKKRDGRNYKLYTTATFAGDYSAIVTGIIVIGDNDEV